MVAKRIIFTALMVLAVFVVMTWLQTVRIVTLDLQADFVRHDGYWIGQVK